MQLFDVFQNHLIWNIEYNNKYQTLNLAISEHYDRSILSSDQGHIRTRIMDREVSDLARVNGQWSAQSDQIVPL